jgi:Ca2+-binding EF-hand superfamily protein
MGNIQRTAHEFDGIPIDDVIDRCHQLTGLNHDNIRHEHQRFFHLAEHGRLKKVYVEELLADHIPDSKWKHMKYFIDCLFKAIDTNENGSIDFLEYIMTRKLFHTALPIEKANFIFRMIDRNGDQLITRKELERILKCLEEHHQQSTNRHVTHLMTDGIQSAVNTIVDKLDEHRSGVIDRTQFVHGWLNDETIREIFTF